MKPSPRPGCGEDEDEEVEGAIAGWSGGGGGGGGREAIESGSVVACNTSPAEPLLAGGVGGGGSLAPAAPAPADSSLRKGLLVTLLPPVPAGGARLRWLGLMRGGERSMGEAWMKMWSRVRRALVREWERRRRRARKVPITEGVGRDCIVEEEVAEGPLKKARICSVPYAYRI